MGGETPKKVVVSCDRCEERNARQAAFSRWNAGRLPLVSQSGQPPLRLHLSSKAVTAVQMPLTPGYGGDPASARRIRVALLPEVVPRHADHALMFMTRTGLSGPGFRSIGMPTAAECSLLLMSFSVTSFRPRPRVCLVRYRLGRGGDLTWNSNIGVAPEQVAPSYATPTPHRTAGRHR